MIFLQERLASLTRTTTNLVAQLSELNELRERVRDREAQLAGRLSFPNPIHRSSSGWTVADTKKAFPRRSRALTPVNHDSRMAPPFADRSKL